MLAPENLDIIPALTEQKRDRRNKYAKSSKSKGVGIFNNWEQKYWTASNLAII